MLRTKRTWASSTQSLTSSVMADTGCQSCLAGIRVIGRFDLIPADLTSVTTKMNAADEKGINILGAAILRFSGIDQPGHSLETRQITNITDCSDRIFLSRDACIQLGMISESFPTVGEILQNSAEKYFGSHDSQRYLVFDINSAGTP